MTPAQAAQLDLAALLEPDLLLEVGVGLGQLAHDPRDEHLAAVGQVGDPRRLDHRAPVQVVLERHRLARVQAHPHAQVGRPGERQRALDLDRAAQRRVGAGEGEQMTVAQRLDQRAPVAGDALGEHLLVLGEPRQPARLTQALEQGGRTLDVGEDDGDRGTGGSRHPPILTDQGTGDGCGGRAPRDAAARAGLGHRGGDGLGDAAVEHAGDDVVGVQLVVADDGRDRARGGELHLLVDRARADVERAAEDAGEGEDVVDLVGVVRAAGGHDRDVVADLLGLDLGDRVGHREDDRVRGHACAPRPPTPRPGPRRRPARRRRAARRWPCRARRRGWCARPARRARGRAPGAPRRARPRGRRRSCSARRGRG